MEIVQQRLERHFGWTLITTRPSVRYRVTTTDGAVLEIRQTRPSCRPPRRSSAGMNPVITR